jgi:hypothetical protein
MIRRWFETKLLWTKTKSDSLLQRQKATVDATATPLSLFYVMNYEIVTHISARNSDALESLAHPNRPSVDVSLSSHPFTFLSLAAKTLTKATEFMFF